MKEKKNVPVKNEAMPDDEITRKEALIKVGRYITFTAAAMLTLLSPSKSQTESPPGPSW